MLCLQIELNGKVVTIAGKENAENISASITLLPSKNVLLLLVDATAPNNKATHDYSLWDVPSLHQEDKLCIQVIESSHASHSYVARAGEGVLDSTPQEGPVCLLCGKTHLEVDSMVQCKRGFICHECISDLSETVNDHPEG
jgi:hypothetical protein